MRYSRLAFGLVLFAPLVVPQAVPAGSGVVTGTAFDPHKHTEAAVKISLERDDRKQVISGKTDSHGKYRMVLSTGRYHLHAEGLSGEKASIGSVIVDEGKITRLDLVLEVTDPGSPQFFDEPKFTIAGVKDNTYRGGHGSDNVLRSAEDLTQATASLSNADDAEPHHKLAEADERDGHPVEAAREFELAAKLNPSEQNVFDWGTELLSHRAFTAAIEVLNNGHRAFPQSTRMLLGLATASYAEGMYAQAADWFFQAIDQRPEDETAYLFLAKVQAPEIVESNGYEERMARFVRLHPQNALANYYYGLALLHKNGRAADDTLTEQARQLFSKSLIIDPHFGAASLQLGITDVKQGKYSDAIQLYERAIADDPNLEEAHYRLSDAYRMMGDDAKSSAELSVYRQLSKSSSEKREKQRQTVQQFVVDLQNTKK